MHLQKEKNLYLFSGNTMPISEEPWVPKMKLCFLYKSKMKFQHKRDDLQVPVASIFLKDYSHANCPEECICLACLPSLLPFFLQKHTQPQTVLHLIAKQNSTVHKRRKKGLSPFMFSPPEKSLWTATASAGAACTERCGLGLAILKHQAKEKLIC